MKNTIALLCTILIGIFYCNQANAQKFDWVKKIGTQCLEGPIANDTSGNVYAQFEIVGTMTLGAYTISSPDVLNATPVLAKFDSNGNVLWAKKMPLFDSSVVGFTPGMTKIKVSPLGWVWVVGTVTYPPPKGQVSYILAYRPDGSRAVYSDAPSVETNVDIAFDSIGNAYMCGSYVTSHIEKFDTSGNVKWRYYFSTAGYENISASIYVNGGNVYIAGTFKNRITLFDTAGTSPITFTVTTSGNYDLFEAKYTLGGHLVAGYTKPGIYSYGATGIGFAASFSTAGIWELVYPAKDLASTIYNNRNEYDLGFTSVSNSSVGTGCLFASTPLISVSNFREEGIATWTGFCGVGDAYKYAPAGADVFPIAYDHIASYGPHPAFSFDKNSTIYVSSGFEGTINYTTGTGAHSLSSAGTTADVYIAKYHRCKTYSPTAVKKTDTLFCSDTTTGLVYQWCFNGDTIKGQTHRFYIPTKTGNYTVKVADTWGCSATSPILTVTVGIEKLNTTKNISLYPNPTSSTFVIGGLPSATEIQITDLAGKTVISLPAYNGGSIDISTLQRGMYLLKTKYGTQKLSKL